MYLRQFKNTAQDFIQDEIFVRCFDALRIFFGNTKQGWYYETCLWLIYIIKVYYLTSPCCSTKLLYH